MKVFPLCLFKICFDGVLTRLKKIFSFTKSINYQLHGSLTWDLIRVRWLDKLGVAAKYGYEVVLRQALFYGHYSLIGEDLEPNPVS